MKTQSNSTLSTTPKQRYDSHGDGMIYVQLLVLLLALVFTLTGIYLLMTASLGMSFFCLVSAIACAVTHSLLERREHEQYL